MISDVYFPRVNGVSTSIETFRRALAGLGHAVTLIAPRYGADDGADEQVMRVPSRYLFLDPEDRMMKAAAIRRLVPRLKGRFDLVHVQTPFVAHYMGKTLARRLGLPVLETYHTFFEEYLHHYVPWLPAVWMRAAARGFSRSQCNGVDRVIVPSRAMLEVLRRYGVRTGMEVVATGLPASRFQEGDGARFRARHDIDPLRPVLVHVGRVAYEKNIDFLLRVLVRVRHAVPDALLVIAGEGPARGALQRQVRELGLGANVHFTGYLDRDGELLDCYRAGDAFVFASRTETQGLVLLEAMAQGVPVVSTAIGGTRDILDAGRGALVPPDSEPAFAQAVLQLLNDAALRRRLGEDARVYAQQWSEAFFAERLVEVYRRVLGGEAADPLGRSAAGESSRAGG